MEIEYYKFQHQEILDNKYIKTKIILDLDFCIRDSFISDEVKKELLRKRPKVALVLVEAFGEVFTSILLSSFDKPNVVVACMDGDVYMSAETRFFDIDDEEWTECEEEQQIGKIKPFDSVRDCILFGMDYQLGYNYFGLSDESIKKVIQIKEIK